MKKWLLLIAILSISLAVPVMAQTSGTCESQGGTCVAANWCRQSIFNIFCGGPICPADSAVAMTSDCHGICCVPKTQPHICCKFTTFAGQTSYRYYPQNLCVATPDYIIGPVDDTFCNPTPIPECSADNQCQWCGVNCQPITKCSDGKCVCPMIAVSGYDCKCVSNKCQYQKIPEVCQDWQSKCDGNNVMQCKNNQWVLKTTCQNGCTEHQIDYKTSGPTMAECNPSPRVCYEKSTRCDGNNLMLCQGNQWVLKTTCQYGCQAYPVPCGVVESTTGITPPCMTENVYPIPSFARCAPGPSECSAGMSKITISSRSWCVDSWWTDFITQLLGKIGAIPQ